MLANAFHHSQQESVSRKRRHERKTSQPSYNPLLLMVDRKRQACDYVVDHGSSKPFWFGLYSARSNSPAQSSRPIPLVNLRCTYGNPLLDIKPLTFLSIWLIGMSRFEPYRLEAFKCISFRLPNECRWEARLSSISSL